MTATPNYKQRIADLLLPYARRTFDDVHARQRVDDIADFLDDFLRRVWSGDEQVKFPVRFSTLTPAVIVLLLVEPNGRVSISKQPPTAADYKTLDYARRARLNALH